MSGQLCTVCHHRTADLLGLSTCVVCAGLIKQFKPRRPRPVARPVTTKEPVK